MHIAAQAMRTAVATYLGEDPFSKQQTHGCHIAWWVARIVRIPFSRDQQISMWVYFVEQFRAKILWLGLFVDLRGATCKHTWTRQDMPLV